MIEIWNFLNLLYSRYSRYSKYSHEKLSLKGNGNETDFLGFLQNLVPHESLTLPFDPFRFWLRIRGDIRNRKTTPRLTELGSQKFQHCIGNWFRTEKAEYLLLLTIAVAFTSNRFLADAVSDVINYLFSCILEV
jgi:hypothetical protein